MNNDKTLLQRMDMLENALVNISALVAVVASKLGMTFEEIMAQAKIALDGSLGSNNNETKET